MKHRERGASASGKAGPTRSTEAVTSGHERHQSGDNEGIDSHEAATQLESKRKKLKMHIGRTGAGVGRALEAAADKRMLDKMPDAG